MSTDIAEAAIRSDRFIDARTARSLVASCCAAFLSRLIDVWRTRRTTMTERCLRKGIRFID